MFTIKHYCQYLYLILYLKICHETSQAGRAFRNRCRLIFCGAAKKPSELEFFGLWIRTRWPGASWCQRRQWLPLFSNCGTVQITPMARTYFQDLLEPYQGVEIVVDNPVSHSKLKERLPDLPRRRRPLRRYTSWDGDGLPLRQRRGGRRSLKGGKAQSSSRCPAHSRWSSMGILPDAPSKRDFAPRVCYREPSGTETTRIDTHLSTGPNVSPMQHPKKPERHGSPVPEARTSAIKSKLLPIKNLRSHSIHAGGLSPFLFDTEKTEFHSKRTSILIEEMLSGLELIDDGLGTSSCCSAIGSNS